MTGNDYVEFGFATDLAILGAPSEDLVASLMGILPEGSQMKVGAEVYMRAGHWNDGGPAWHDTKGNVWQVGAISGEVAWVKGPAEQRDGGQHEGVWRIPWHPIPVIAAANHELLCPMCGGGNLHQRFVRVGARKCEDIPGVVVDAEFDKGTVSVRVGEESDYVGRRDDLTVEFWCEQCPWPSQLQIAQHEGITIMQWVPPGASKAVIHR